MTVERPGSFFTLRRFYKIFFSILAIIFFISSATNADSRAEEQFVGVFFTPYTCMETIKRVRDYIHSELPNDAEPSYLQNAAVLIPRLCKQKWKWGRPFENKIPGPTPVNPDVGINSIVDALKK
jgi:hypothetical protein